MRSPIDEVKGKIVDVSPDGTVTIKAKYDDIEMMLKREYKECVVRMIDSRHLSNAQRRTCYMLLREISDYTGMGLDPTKEYMKLKFLAEDLLQTADDIFSLSDAPMSLVCAFQRFLVRFILDWDIPVSFPLIEFVDDISDYIYACSLTKKCCICGSKAEPHHYKRIGMGGNRKTVDQTGMTMLPLCREHHIECHSMVQADFDKAYHVVPVTIDDALKRVWGFNGKRKHKTYGWMDDWFSDSDEENEAKRPAVNKAN